jgi:hypothetical protein
MTVLLSSHQWGGWHSSRQKPVSFSPAGDYYRRLCFLQIRNTIQPPMGRVAHTAPIRSLSVSVQQVIITGAFASFR